MERLKEVTEKICELLKGSELEFTICDTLSTDFNGKLFRTIKEAEVLMALISIDGMIHADGWIRVIINRVIKDADWQLGKPLSEQSKETIEFLHEILVR